MNKLKSRKFVLAVVSSAVMLANSLTEWNLDAGQIMAFLGPILLWMGIEGVADIKAASRKDGE